MLLVNASAFCGSNIGGDGAGMATAFELNSNVTLSINEKSVSA